MNKQVKRVAIIGAGPAGLTAAYLLGKAGGFNVQVFEKDAQYVGGISRTEHYKGYYFDIGGHRFFSKSQEVEDFWTEILGDELLERPRSSSIYYNHKLFSYPLVAGEALRKLGLLEAGLCVLSYLQSRMFPIKNPANFEEWVSNQFGGRLFRIFFKTYTEKVWGIPCTQISADWAAQRIKGLSLSSAIWNAVFPRRKQHKQGPIIKTLIDSFRYPKFGPGQMWETCKAKAEALGVVVGMNQPITQLFYHQDKHQWQIGHQNSWVEGEFDYVICSAPLRQLVGGIKNPLSLAVRDAAQGLAYRDFITVVLMLKDQHRFNENWIYIHDPNVKVGRVQNFKSWSPYMVPDKEMACYGLEYFCFEGDGLWNSSDADLVALGTSEMVTLGLIDGGMVLDSYVVRQPKAYPVYNQEYQTHIETIKRGLQPFEGLILTGRNGMHKYNNQDHSMMTAMLAVKNIVAGEMKYDLWKVNQDAEYHEDGELANAGGRSIPTSV
ncbi:MAG: NAD(P)/FAD-dependent oxidoreductase [Bacteroidetes bacterium]|nr:MAG: NAD(P)/FAD-dependent oxidoreductase [Bacteroidota bacterium]